MPALGKTESVIVNLESLAAGPIDGGRGIIRIEGIDAQVELISISGQVGGNGYTDIYGNAELSVYTVGTPITEVRVSALGLMNVSRNDLEMPGPGQTKAYKVPLTPLNPTSVPTASTTTPHGPFIAGFGAVTLIKRDYFPIRVSGFLKGRGNVMPAIFIRQNYYLQKLQNLILKWCISCRMGSLGSCAERKRKTQEALTVLRMATTDAPRMDSVWCARGVVLFKAGETDTAVVCFGRAARSAELDKFWSGLFEYSGIF